MVSFLVDSALARGEAGGGGGGGGAAGGGRDKSLLAS